MARTHRRFPSVHYERAAPGLEDVSLLWFENHGAKHRGILSPLVLSFRYPGLK